MFENETQARNGAMLGLPLPRMRVYDPNDTCSPLFETNDTCSPLLKTGVRPDLVTDRNTCRW